MSKSQLRAALIADIKDIQAQHPKAMITRNFYRANGKFTESYWQKFFPKFSDLLAAAGIEYVDKEPEVNEISGDSWQISLPETSIHTLDELLDHCKVNLAEWEVEKFIVNKWEAHRGQGYGLKDVYQVKAWLKRRSEIIFVRDEIAELKKAAKETARTPRPVSRPKLVSGNMLEVNIPDIHVGKLAWPTETGYEPYDTKIAVQMFERALETLLDRASHYTFDQVVFVVGNDLFNSDDIEGRTTKGTVVTTDGRYHKTFYKVRHMITDAIERLRRVAPVKVIMVSGNHDNLSVWHLGDSLECYFAKYPDVEIDNTPQQRKFIQWGEVMLMFTHGDKGKRTDYPLLMATERSAMFGATKYRECHTGHTHMTKLDEQHGVRVRVLPALCPPDDWHAENAFTGNLRNAEGYIWNKHEGLVSQVYYCDQAYDQIQTKRELVA